MVKKGGTRKEDPKIKRRRRKVQKRYKKKVGNRSENPSLEKVQQAGQKQTMRYLKVHTGMNTQKQ